MERPALNPTSNVTTRKPPPLGGLAYQKDSSWPGGGVFVAHGKAKGAFPGLAPGLIIESNSDEEDQGEVMSVLFKEDRLMWGTDGAPPAGAHDTESGGQMSSMQDGNVNVNPVLNEGGRLECENVHVMNTLDSGTASTRALEQLALADNNLLDGIPGGMFDWGAWLEPSCMMNDSLSRMNLQGGGTSSSPGSTPRETLKHWPRLYFRLDSRSRAPRWFLRWLVMVRRRNRDESHRKILCRCQRVVSISRFGGLINGVGIEVF